MLHSSFIRCSEPGTPLPLRQTRTVGRPPHSGRAPIWSDMYKLHNWGARLCNMKRAVSTIMGKTKVTTGVVWHHTRRHKDCSGEWGGGILLFSRQRTPCLPWEQPSAGKLYFMATEETRANIETHFPHSKYAINQNHKYYVSGRSGGVKYLLIRFLNTVYFPIWECIIIKKDQCHRPPVNVRLAFLLSCTCVLEKAFNLIYILE